MITITAEELDSSSAEEIGARVLQEMTAGNLYSDDPMGDTSTSKGLKVRFKSFKTNFLEFFDKLLRDSSETDELFDGADLGTERSDGKTFRSHSVASTSSLFDGLSDLVALFSGVRARTIRAAATAAGLQLVSSLVHIAKVKAETRDMKQRQLDAEERKKRPNAAILKTLKEALVLTQARIHSVESMIKGSFNKIFTHRFRDIDPSIRTACMHAIGHWMREHPLFFLSDYYLKYLGWSLNDKDPRVRHAVLSALHELYAASTENLALMDTFNARFISRIREMIHDVDPCAAAEAIKTLSVLHEAGVLPREDVEPVISLLLDAHAQIRSAAAAVIPSLIKHDCSHTGNHVKEKVSRNEPVSSSAEDERSRNTLISIIHIIKGLQSSRARTASAVDALWDVYGETLSNWNLIFAMLISEEQNSERVAAQAPILSEQAAGLTNLLSCAVRRSQGEILIRTDSYGSNGIGVQRPPNKAQRDAHEHARESFTQSAMEFLPSVLQRWRADEAVIGPLIETAQHLKLEHYSLKHKEPEFERLMKLISEIFRQHTSRCVMDACTGVLYHATTEGNESLKDIGKRTIDTLFLDIGKNLHDSTHALRSEWSRMKSKGKHPTVTFGEEDVNQFQVRVELVRLNALVSMLPPSPNTSQRVGNMYDDLIQIIVDAGNGVASLEVRSISLAIRAASLVLVHHLFDLLDKSKISQADVNEHIASRDTFMSSVVALVKVAVEMYPHSRILPKAALSAVANLIVYCQQPRVLDALNTDRGTTQSACLERLDLRPDETTFRAVWDTCNHLLDMPEESPDENLHMDDEGTGDEEVARIAYALAICDVAVTNHRFVAAELFANRGHSGQWTDASIAALLADLRQLGPQTTGSTITTSLVSAFEEVMTGDVDNSLALEEAFGELASRLAGMFAIGSQRDRAVVRSVIEESLKFVLPTSSLVKPTRLPFLLLGLAAFIPKLAASDAKTLMEPLSTILAGIDEEDESFAPLLEFVSRVNARARGAPGFAGKGSEKDGVVQKKRKEDMRELESKEVEEIGGILDEETPVEVFGGRRRR